MNNVERRRSGRTHRMLDEAYRLACDGQAVVIVGADAIHMGRLRGMFLDRWANHACDLVATGKVSFQSAHGCDSSIWQNGQVHGQRATTLADHYAIEVHLKWALPWALQQWLLWNEIQTE